MNFVVDEDADLLQIERGMRAGNIAVLVFSVLFLGTLALCIFAWVWAIFIDPPIGGISWFVGEALAVF